jgi:streptogramin lyase
MPQSGGIMRFIIFLTAVFLASQTAAQPFAAFGKASKPELNDPHDLTIGPDGRLYVADKFGERIVVMDAESLEILSTFGEGVLFGVHDISFGPNGLAYVAAAGANSVYVFDLSGEEAKVVNVIPGAIRVEGVLAHFNGRVYVMASGTGELVAFENGTPVAGIRGLFGAHDVVEALDGTIWVADNARAQLVHVDAELKLISILNDVKFGMLGPRYLAVDDFGRLIVSDQDAHRILMIDPETETLLGVLGDGIPGKGANKFDDPEGAAVHGSVYYFSDSDNDRIVRYVVLVN